MNFAVFDVLLIASL